MKKIKIFFIAILAFASIGILAGCGDTEEKENGSNNDPETRNEESTGIIEEIITDAVDDGKEIGSDIENGLDNNDDIAPSTDPLNDNSGNIR